MMSLTYVDPNPLWTTPPWADSFERHPLSPAPYQVTESSGTLSSHPTSVSWSAIKRTKGKCDGAVLWFFLWMKKRSEKASKRKRGGNQLMRNELCCTSAKAFCTFGQSKPRMAQLQLCIDTSRNDCSRSFPCYLFLCRATSVSVAAVALL